jgi:ATP-dependent DNA ligase
VSGSPFSTAVPAQHARGAHWVHPQLVGEVTFTEWTTGRVLRHPRTSPLSTPGRDRRSVAKAP